MRLRDATARAELPVLPTDRVLSAIHAQSTRRHCASRTRRALLPLTLAAARILHELYAEAREYDE